MPPSGPPGAFTPGSTRLAGLALLAGDAPSTGPRLVGVSGPGAGRTVAAVDGLRLARARDADVPLLDAWASRGGVRLVRAGEALCAVELGGRSARLNGRRVPRRGRALRAGDVLTLGRSAWLFHEDPAPRDPPSAPKRAHRGRLARVAAVAALGLCAAAAAAAAGGF